MVDGELAYIKVGQAVHYTQEWLTLTQRYTNMQRTTDWLEVSTGFTVRPRMLSQQIELAITPRIAQLNSNDFIDFETLSTVVLVHADEWLDLGGMMQQKDALSRAILNSKNTEEFLTNALLIRVD